MKIALISFAMILCISGNVFGVLSGSGTEVDPYLIQSRADFDEFASPANAALYWASGVYTKLMCDIDLAGTTYTQAVIAPDTDNTASLFQGTTFDGVFEGSGHTISNLTITAPIHDYVGLFGCIFGQISKLYVENVIITGRDHVGGLVGYNSDTIAFCRVTGSVSGTSNYVGGLTGANWGSITSCYAIGSVSGTSHYVGGLVGRNIGTLASCYATGAVSGKNYVGGLAGENTRTITSCYATGAVSGTSDYVGGLVGWNKTGTLTSCYATGAVSGTGNTVGGLVGNNSQWGIITSCYSTGSVSGIYYIGGLVGWNYQGTLTSCYATGLVSGSSSAGGLVGYNNSTITFCYATGAVSGSSYVGGLVGSNYEGTLTACFWDIQTSGKTWSAGGSSVVGKTTMEMMTLSTFTSSPASWDFINETTNGTNDYWMMLREGEDYPRLAWQQVYPEDIAGLYGVNVVDYVELAEHWGQTDCPNGCEDADIDGDGTVDILDLMSMADNWLVGI